MGAMVLVFALRGEPRDAHDTHPQTSLHLDIGIRVESGTEVDNGTEAVGRVIIGIEVDVGTMDVG